MASRPGDICYVEPPPIRNDRTMPWPPQVPPDDVELAYPRLQVLEDRAFVVAGDFDRAYTTVDDTGGWRSGEGTRTHGCIGLPIGWFYR